MYYFFCLYITTLYRSLDERFKLVYNFFIYMVLKYCNQEDIMNMLNKVISSGSGVAASMRIKKKEIMTPVMKS